MTFLTGQKKMVITQTEQIIGFTLVTIEEKKN